MEIEIILVILAVVFIPAILVVTVGQFRKPKCPKCGSQDIKSYTTDIGRYSAQEITRCENCYFTIKVKDLNQK